MNKIISFIANHQGDIIFIAVFLVVLLLFLREFKLTDRRSWAMLIGFSILGFLLFRRVYGRNKLLKALEKREKGLKEIENRYNDLKQKHKQVEKNYEKIKDELDRAKVESAKALADLAEKKKEKIQKIEDRFENITPDGAIKTAKELIKKYENKN